MAEDEGNPNTSDCVRVAVRVRPLNDREKAMGSGSTGVSWSLSPTSMTQMVQKKPISANSFAFDHVFLEDINNTAVYGALAAPLVNSTVEGVNTVIFAYGQTAAGKTHTMLGNDNDPGITPRAIMDLFASISNTRGRAFLLRASYIEIYNEEIKDLLGNGAENLKIHEDVVNKRVYVNAKEEVVTSVDDVMKILMYGEQTRAVGVTNMNERSSRSHTIFTLRVESRENNADSAQEEDDDGVAVRASTLTLVDLAGSERAAHTKAEGQRLKEGGHINKSLLTLGTVIGKLSSGETVAHIPYRDSKLTRILQPALGGNARTAILCAVTPSLVHMDETLSTLRFASRAKKVTNHAHRNEFLDDRAKLRRAMKELALLKTKLAAFTHAGVSPKSGSIAVSAADAFAQYEVQNEKRIKMFTPMFEKLVAIASSDKSSRGKKRPSASELKRPEKLRKLNHPTSDGTQVEDVVVPDHWDTKSRLREALDLSGGSRDDKGAVESAGPNTNSDTSDADLRFRALQAERELRQARSEIECERTAMEAEVEQLVSVADNAERSRETAQTEWAQAMSLLKRAQAKSIVDEIVEGAMMISERDRTITTHENEIERIRVVEKKYEETLSKLTVTEKTLSDALKREKRGVGPVLKEKSALEKKLHDTEGKLKGAKENGQRLQSEKAGIERESKMKNAQIRKLQAEVDKHRNKQKMVDERIMKKHEDEKKKLEDQISALKEQKEKEETLVAKQKKEIEDMGNCLSNTAAKLKDSEEESSSLKDTVSTLQGENQKMEETVADQKKEIEDLGENLSSTTDTLKKREDEKIALEDTVSALQEEKQKVEETVVLRNKEIEDVLKNLSNTKDTLKKREEEKCSLEGTVFTLKEHKQQVEDTVTEQKAEIGNLVRELTSTAHDLGNNKEAMLSITEKLEYSNKNVETLRSLLDKARVESEQEKRTAQESLSYERKRVEKGQNALAILNSEARLAKDKLIACTLRAEAAEKEGAVLQLKVSEVIAQLEHERNSSSMVVKSLTSRLGDSQTESKKLEDQISALKHQKEKADSTSARQTQELNDLNKNLSSTMDKLMKREEENNSLKRKVSTVQEEQQKVNEVVAEQRNQIEELEKNLSKSENERSVLELSVSKVREEKKNVENTVALRKKEIEDLQKNLSNTADLLKKCEDEKCSLEDAASALQEDKQKVEETVAEQRKEIESLEKNLSSTTDTLMKREDEKIAFQNVLITLREEKENLENTVTQLRKEIEGLGKNLSSVTGSLEEHENEKTALEETVTEQRRKIEDLEKSLISTTSILKQREDEKSTLVGTVSTLQEEKQKVDGTVAQQRTEIDSLTKELVTTADELKESKEMVSSKIEELTKINKSLTSQLDDARVELKKATLEQQERPALRELNTNKPPTDKSMRTLKEKNTKLLVRCKSLLGETKLAALEKVKIMENKKELLQRVEHLEEQLTQYGRGEGAIAKLKKQVRRADRTIKKLKGELSSVEKLITEKGLADERQLLNRIATAEANYAEVRQELDRMQKAYDEQQKITDAITRDAHRYKQKLVEREAIWTKSVADRREKELVNTEVLLKER